MIVLMIFTVLNIYFSIGNIFNQKEIMKRFSYVESGLDIIDRTTVNTISKLDQQIKPYLSRMEMNNLFVIGLKAEGYSDKEIQNAVHKAYHGKL